MNFDFNNMMQKAKELQSNMSKMKEGLRNIMIEGESGGGMVKLTMNCAFEAQKIEISEDILNDRKMAEDLVVAAINNALSKVQESSSEEMKKIAGPLANIPGFNF